MEVINNALLIQESNVLDLYKKLVNKEDVSNDEKECVLQRFKELVDFR